MHGRKLEERSLAGSGAKVAISVAASDALARFVTSVRYLNRSRCNATFEENTPGVPYG